MLNFSVGCLYITQHLTVHNLITVLYKKALIIFFYIDKKPSLKLSRFEINFEIEVLIEPTIYTWTFDR